MIIHRRWLYIVSFLFIGLILLFYVQNALIPIGVRRENVKKMYEEIGEIENLDVIFMGTSHVYNGISPMELYLNYGITSYDLATSAQPVELLPDLLSEVFLNSSPQIVAVDVSRFFKSDDEDSYWRYVIDNVPNSSLKLNIAKKYLSYNKNAGFLSCFFPIITYHDSWQTLLSSNYFRPSEYRFSFMGYRMVDYWVPASLSGNDHLDSFLQQIDANPSIEANAKDIIDELNSLCKKNNSHLVLIKVPTMVLPTHYLGAWTMQKHTVIKEICQELGVDFYDLQYDYDAKIDWNKDTCDGGRHLNHLGAKKISNVLGKIFQNQNLSPTRTCLFYEKRVEKYKKMEAISSIQLCSKLDDYVNKIKGNEYCIIVAADQDFTAGLDEEDYCLLETLGLKKIKDAQYMDSYLAFIGYGEVSEYLGKELLESDFKVGDVIFHAQSAGYPYGTHAKISSSSGTDVSNSRGLNFWVIDRKTGILIDCVNFDTFLDEKASTHNIAIAYDGFCKISDWIDEID